MFGRAFSVCKHLLLSLIVAHALSGTLYAAEVPAGLQEALRDKDPRVRLQAAQLLVQMGEGKAALPAVEELLKSSDKTIRLEAALLLKQMGPARLAAQLKDPDPSARLKAAQTLWRMGGAEAKDGIPV